MSYDPELRRETPLAAVIRQRIAAEGAITVATYVDLCLNHPEHGYYRTRAAIGRQGDFVTAPEISQTFGELLGLWVVAVWQSMGAPARVRLIELGPGRGTLMEDALRAVRVVPAFLAALDVVLVEINPVLRAEQARMLAGAEVSWAEKFTVELLDSQPTIVIGNEFLDVFPPRQYVVSNGVFVERIVRCDLAGRLVFDGDITGSMTGLRQGTPVLRYTDVPEGTIVEVSTAADAIWPLVTMNGSTQPFAAIFIDYGHTASAPGDTFQAVRNHEFEHPLTSPGEADLSFQVDFAKLRQGLIHLHPDEPDMGIDGPITQAQFLGRLGIIERTQQLMAKNPVKAQAIEMAVARLLQPQGMGGRFLALGIRSHHLPILPGF